MGCFYQVPSPRAEFGSSVEPPLASEFGSLTLAPRSLISGAEVLASVDHHLESVDRLLISMDRVLNSVDRLLISMDRTLKLVDRTWKLVDGASRVSGSSPLQGTIAGNK